MYVVPLCFTLLETNCMQLSSLMCKDLNFSNLRKILAEGSKG